MVDFTNSFNIISYLFERDYENKICVECKSPMPGFVSINNAILLCENCANKHRELGYNISYIREIKDEWDQYLLTFLERGGNSRYIRFTQKYELTEMSIEEKLQTKIMEYYRRLVSILYNLYIYFFLKQIKSEVTAEEPPEEISKEIAKEFSDSDQIFFPEFENYEIYDGKTIIQKPQKPQNTSDNTKSFGSSIGSITSKIKTGASYIYNLSKPVVQYASNKVVEGVGYLYNKINKNNNNDKEIEDGEKINIIRIDKDDDDDDVQRSSLLFEKAQGVDEESENNNKSQENSSISSNNKDNNKNNDENENEKKDKDDSAAPVEIKSITLVENDDDE